MSSIVMNQSSSRLPWRAVLAVACPILLAVGLNQVPPWLLSEIGIQVLVVCSALLIALLIAVVTGTQTVMDCCWRVSAVLWAFLLCSEQLFPRRGAGNAAAYQGDFSGSAYAEPVLWVVIGLVTLVIYLLRPKLFVSLLHGINKWPIAYALLCVFSVVYSPTRLFTLAWAFKLCISLLVLNVLMEGIGSFQRIYNILVVSFWALVFLSVMPILQAIFISPTIFDNNRLNSLVSPVSVSGWAALLFLVSLVLINFGKSRFVFGAAFGSVLMLVAGGKAAIAVGFLSAGLFLVLLKRYWAASACGAAASVLVILLFLTTPIQGNLEQYEQSGEATTLTGRTELWSDAIPDIEANPVLGHGYMSSRFIGMELEERWDAGHLHNAVLEILYCNGLVGLAIVGFMVYRAGGNLRRARRSTRGIGAVLVAGAITLACDLLLNGITEAAFGGRPSTFFLFFLALIAISEVMQRLAQVPMLQSHADRVTGRYRLATIRETSSTPKPRRATSTI